MTVPSEVEALVADAPLSAHLATSIDDRPHVAPVWYGYRDGTLYFITGGQKLSNMRHNPRVAMSIEQSRDGDVEWNVTLLGTATIRDDPDRIERASDWIYEMYDDEETANGGERPSDGGRDTTRRTDGGEPADERPNHALVEVEIGSCSANIYE